MYARHRLDIGLGDLLRAAAPPGLPAPGAPGSLRCLSVRSGFHLLLGALRLPRGTEVVFSALTHPDLPRIAEHHGLVPVPVDLDPDTLAPSPAALAAALTPRTGLAVVAHLFGGLADLDPLAGPLRRAGVPLVEDCAQAYAGPADAGDARTIVSMFSFGLLKTATAVGGAVLHVRDAALLDRMEAAQAAWPAQEEGAYLARLAGCAAFVAGGRPLPYGLLAAHHRLAGRDLDRTVNGAVRSFPAATAAELVRALERRPSGRLLAALARRRFDAARLARRAAAGERAMALVPPVLCHPGGAMRRRTHWLFPVVAADPDAVVAAARRAGFDAARAASNLHAVAAPPGRPEPARARRMLAGLVYLPMYPEVPRAERDRLLTEVLRTPGS